MVRLTIDSKLIIYHFHGMSITIEKTGRVVTPAHLRTKPDAGPELKIRGKRKLARPIESTAEQIDIASRIEEERNR